MPHPARNLFARVKRGRLPKAARLSYLNQIFDSAPRVRFALGAPCDEIAGELRALTDGGEADWQFIQPSIMGTLFERALEPEQRSQLGAHYTSEADLTTPVEPLPMAP